ncbi:iron-sulfur cluster co-chaperone protein HscB-like [Anolis carolinensis]|uniref:iron-sulfur cluster co-chaperone protein HscB-like n=1 Tax=Anolis carolinensis TaxID=28377 RepID=UPI002F2B41F0
MWLWALRRGLRPWRALSSRAWISCWSCGLALPANGSQHRFCPSCRALQPPEPQQDLFSVMGCERRFRLDASGLRRSFRALQGLLHPDRFSRSTQVERGFSEEHSSLVNKAYRTLLNPISRGIYLLELNGVSLEQGTDPGSDPEFLSEIMETNERLQTPNASWPTSRRNSLPNERNCWSASAELLMQGDLSAAKSLLTKMKYFSNLEEKLKEKKAPP